MNQSFPANDKTRRQKEIILCCVYINIILFYCPFWKRHFSQSACLKKGIIIFICGIKRIYTYANSLKPELLKNFKSIFFGGRGGGGWVILVVAYVGRKNTDHYEGKKKQSEQVKERSRLRNYC